MLGVVDGDHVHVGQERIGLALAAPLPAVEEGAPGHHFPLHRLVNQGVRGFQKGVELFKLLPIYLGIVLRRDGGALHGTAQVGDGRLRGLIERRLCCGNCLIHGVLLSF